MQLQHYAKARSLLRRTIPVARRVSGDDDVNTLRLRWNYARTLVALYEDADATLDDLREAVTTFEDVARISRRVLGGAHPTMPRTVNGTGHTGPSEFCATSI